MFLEKIAEPRVSKYILVDIKKCVGKFPNIFKRYKHASLSIPNSEHFQPPP